MKSKKKDVVETILSLILILFGVFVIYQVIRILIGGSWEPENVIIVLLMFTLSLTVVILKKSDKNSYKIDNIKRSFNSLAIDFKHHMDEYHYKKRK